MEHTAQNNNISTFASAYMSGNCVSAQRSETLENLQQIKPTYSYAFFSLKQAASTTPIQYRRFTDFPRNIPVPETLFSMPNTRDA